MKNIIAALMLFLVAGVSAPALAGSNVSTDGGLYYSLHGIGVNARITNGVEHVDMQFGWGASAALGYVWAFPKHAGDFRIELEGSYRSVSFDSIVSPFVPTPTNTANVDGDLWFGSGLVNVIVDFHTGSRVTPHIGLGIGYSRIDQEELVLTDDLGVEVQRRPKFRDDVAVMQGIVGLGYRLTPGWIVDFEYRIFNPTDPLYNGFMSNEFTVGFRGVF